MLIKTLSLILTVVIPKLASEAYDAAQSFFGDVEENTKKVPDRTILNTATKKAILSDYNYWIKNNKTKANTKCKNQIEFIEYLNTKYHLNKSLSTFAKIWRKNERS